MRTLAAVFVTLALGTFALGGDADQKALQGKWEGVIEGKDQLTFTFKDNKWTLQAKEKKEFSFSGTFKLDAAAKPKAIDLKIEGGSDKEKTEKYIGKTSLGIYEISGDTLRWCASEPGNTDRPTAFEKGAGHLLVEFKRVK